MKEATDERVAENQPQHDCRAEAVQQLSVCDAARGQAETVLLDVSDGEECGAESEVGVTAEAADTAGRVGDGETCSGVG